MATKKVRLSRIDDNVNFIATNEDNSSILLDGSSAIGGKGNGVRPMETLLMGVAGCSGIDIVVILKKMKQEIRDLKIDVEAETYKEDDVTKYRTINLHFHLWGAIKEDKLQKAIDMSMNTYCSVAKILEKSAKITSSYTLKK